MDQTEAPRQPRALIAQFKVEAGVIPGDAMPGYSRVWNYTDMDRDADRTHHGLGRSRFEQMRHDSRRYADELTDPRKLNWVRHEWMWL
jgi:hypothetical protein